MAVSTASARRYAEAVVDLASEAGSGDAWVRDLSVIAGFVSEPEVASLLASGKVPRDEKLRLLSAGIESSVSPQAWNLVRLLEQRGKTYLAPRILELVSQSLDESRGVTTAVVTTAVPLDESERAAVAQRLSALTGKQVNITPVVDETIIGGIVARIGDELIDGSTRSRLVALKRRLEGATR